MKENRKPHVFMLHAAAVLLILVLLSTCMVAGRYARYTTVASDEDSARVAKFSVTETGVFREKVKVDMIPGQTVQLEIHIKNDSEVAVEYTVTAKNEYENLPLEFSLIDNGQAVTAAVLAPEKEKNLLYQISWPASENSDQYIGMVDLIHLTIQVSQID